MWNCVWYIEPSHANNCKRLSEMCTNQKECKFQSLKNNQQNDKILNYWTLIWNSQELITNASEKFTGKIPKLIYNIYFKSN